MSARLPRGTRDLICTLNQWPADSPDPDGVQAKQNNAARELVALFMQVDPDLRKRIITAAKPFKIACALGRYAIATVRESVEREDVSLLVEGVVAFVIQNLHGEDPRSYLEPLVHFARAARKLKVEPQTVFERAVAFAEPECAAFIRKFMARKSEPRQTKD